MNPILPTVPSLPQGQPLTPVGHVLATLTQLPNSSLNNLLVGALLSGTVIGRDAKGQTLLQTNQGVFGLKTATPLPIGASVMLEVQSAGAQLQTVVLSVTPPASARAQAPAMPAVITPFATPDASAHPAPHAPLPAATPNAASHAAPQAATSHLAQPTTITATVIAPPGGATAPAAPAAPTTQPTTTPATIAGPAIVPAPIGEELPGSTAVFARPAPQATVVQVAPPQTPAAPAPSATLSAAAGPPPDHPLPAAPAPARAVAPNVAMAAPQISALPPAIAGEPAPAQALPTGTQVQVRVLPDGPAAPHTPPGLVLGAPANTASTQVVTAAVVGRTPQGQTIVETPVGRMAMTLPPQSSEVLAGKLLALELSAIARPGNPEPPPLAQRHSAMSITHEWPAMKAVIAAASDGPDPVLRLAIENAVPRPGPRLAQQLLQAVANGDTRQALIESVVKPLERAGLSELAQRIQSDLQDLQKLGTTPNADWRLAFVPFFDGQEVRQLRIYSRRKKNDPARKGESGTRFLIECEHGELGALQLDGFLHKQSLDVIVRSHSDLPVWMRGDMIALFTDACGAIGMSGRLQFNAVPVFPVSPMDEIAGAGTGVLV